MSAEAVTNITPLRTLEAVAESPFYIPMTGPAARPRRSLKHDDTFIVLDGHGDIGASAGGPDGLFNADTRYLARLELGWRRRVHRRRLAGQQVQPDADGDLNAERSQNDPGDQPPEQPRLRDAVRVEIRAVELPAVPARALDAQQPCERPAGPLIHRSR